VTSETCEVVTSDAAACEVNVRRVKADDQECLFGYDTAPKDVTPNSNQNLQFACDINSRHLIGGQVQVVFSTIPPALGYIKADKLRALAVTTSTRFEGAPDISTMGDFVRGYETSQWYGIGVPTNTPVEIVEKLNKEINAALADPKMKARLADIGGTVLPGSPADFRKLIADETEKWAKVVRFSGAKPE
jgi:hypothetical protein